MTNKELNKLKKSIAFSAVIEIMGFSIIGMIALCFLVDTILNEILVRLAISISYSFWYYAMTNKSMILLSMYPVILLITSFFVITRKFRYLSDVVSSIDKIISTPEENIQLSANLAIIENKLNKIRLNLIRSRSKAKEEELKKNDLIMYMAHDLKTPLTSVIGYLTLLEEEKKMSKDLRDKYIKIALEKSLRLEELTNQFFEITQYNLHDMPINQNTIDLSILLDQLVEEMYPMTKDKNLKIDVTKENDIMYNGDGTLLARAFTNLIKNSINYCYANTHIKISLKTKDDVIVFEIKNKGDKIPDYKLAKIFEKFYRISTSRNSKSGGAGLGLSITKEIIERHNGTIEVTNPKDDIIFTIKLPK